MNNIKKEHLITKDRAFTYTIDQINPDELRLIIEGACKSMTQKMRTVVTPETEEELGLEGAERRVD